jgi:hypothetical protein
LMYIVCGWRKGLYMSGKQAILCSFYVSQDV